MAKKKPNPKPNPINLEHAVEIDSSYVNNCEQYGCEEEGICRCGHYVDVVVDSVHIPSIARILDHEFFRGVEDNRGLRIYALDRLARSLQLYDTSKYEVEVCGGYYGEEIEAVYLQDESDLRAGLEEIRSFKSPKEFVSFTLMREYNEVLDQLNLENWQRSRISILDVTTGNTQYLQRIPKDNLYIKELKKEKPFIKDTILGLVTRVGSKYRLWDGYHRYSAAKKLKLKSGIFLLGSSD